MPERNGSNLAEFLAGVDRSKFETTPYQLKVSKPWGHETLWTPPGLPYVGKILHILGGYKISLQVHDQKSETQYLLRGKVILLLENNRGMVETINMTKGVGYSNQPGQRHRLIAITDADVLEVSIPEIGNTYRLEDDYTRPTETEEMRAQPNRGWSQASQ